MNFSSFLQSSHIIAKHLGNLTGWYWIFLRVSRPELDPIYYPMRVVSELSVKLSCFLEVYHPDGGPGLIIDEQEGASYELVWGEEVGLCTQLADFSQSVNVLDLEDRAEVDRYQFQKKIKSGTHSDRLICYQVLQNSLDLFCFSFSLEVSKWLSSHRQGLNS